MKNLSVFLFVFAICINPFEGIKTTVVSSKWPFTKEMAQ
ncbi:hypothetical protein EUTSA_v10009884mg, partial [Eutrema salsugineum]